MRIPPSPPFSKGGTSPVPAQAELDFTTTPPFEKGGPGGIPAHQGARMTAAWMENLELLAEAPGGVERLRAMFTKMAILGAFTSCAAPDFETVQLGSVVNFKNGYAFKSEWFSKSGVRLARNANVGHGTLDWRECAYLREDLAGEYSAFGLSSGDILLSLDRPIISTGLKVAVVTDRDLPCLLLQRVAKLTPLAGRLAPDFLLHWLRSPLFVNVIDPGRSNGVPHISTKQVAALPIQLPPLAEQHRIVAKVDELMALCDRLEARQADAQHAHARLVQALLDSLTQARDAEEFQAAWERVAGEFEAVFTTEASVDALRASVLQLGVLGRLGTGIASDEAAPMLLERLGASPSPDTSEPLPNNWCWTKFSNICSIRSALVRPEDHLDEPQVAPDCIEKGTGRLLFKRTVRDSGVRGPNSRFYPGQLVYSKIRPSLSKVILVDFAGLCSADMYPIDSRINAKYQIYLMLSENFLSQVRVAENRVKMPKLNQESLNDFLVPLPPLAEQHRIVAKVTELLALCDQLKARIVAARAKQAQLAEALVKQAVATAAG